MVNSVQRRTERNPSERETLREPSGNMTQRTGRTSRVQMSVSCMQRHFVAGAVFNPSLIRWLPGPRLEWVQFDRPLAVQ